MFIAVDTTQEEEEKNCASDTLNTYVNTHTPFNTNLYENKSTELTLAVRFFEVSTPCHSHSFCVDIRNADEK